MLALLSMAQLAPAEERIALKPRDTFKDCTECPELVVIPAGSFVMGSPTREKHDTGSHLEAEGPQHRVTFASPFAAGKFEVTFAEWDACVSAGGCRHEPDDQGWGRGKRPVINVSWDDAKEYVAWLSRKTGRTYRLLTEAEWEYAARAGTTTRYAFGNQITKQKAQFSGSSAFSADKTVEVGSFKPNSFGLHDMHGNVFEWVEDCSHANYRGAPTDGSAWVEACDKNHRVGRGGCWANFPGALRSAFRSRGPGSRSQYQGFRVARTLP